MSERVFKHSPEVRKVMAELKREYRARKKAKADKEQTNDATA